MFDKMFAEYINQTEKQLGNIFGEEETNRYLVLPLFQMLGYNTGSQFETQPEKVNYALKINTIPVIFVKCKTVNTKLAKYDEELAKYFNVIPSVRIGILTNGIQVKVFTDLQQPNIMDDEPWLDFDLHKTTQPQIQIFQNFCKTKFDIDRIVNLAQKTILYNKIDLFIKEQMFNGLGKGIIRLIAEEFQNIGYITCVNDKVIEQLTPICLQLFKQTLKSRQIDY